MKKGILNKFASTNNAVSANKLAVRFSEDPEDGRSFIAYHGYEIAENEFTNYIITSRITEVQKVKGGWIFRTLNSVYSLIEQEEQ